jgi:hypothetical protein
MNRTSVTFPAYLSGGMCGAAAMFVDKGHPMAAGVCFIVAVGLLLLAERAFDKWVEYWDRRP